MYGMYNWVKNWASQSPYTVFPILDRLYVRKLGWQFKAAIVGFLTYLLLKMDHLPLVFCFLVLSLTSSPLPPLFLAPTLPFIQQKVVGTSIKRQPP